MTDVAVARPETGVSRRTLVAGAAWSIPVVIGAAAIPAVAASTPESFASYFTWRSFGTFTHTSTALKLTNAIVRYIGTAPAVGSFTLATSPAIPGGWVANISVPTSASFSLSSQSDLSVTFSLSSATGATIPSGTYTITATVVFDAGGTHHTLSTGGSVTV